MTDSDRFTAEMTDYDRSENPIGHGADLRKCPVRDRMTDFPRYGYTVRTHTHMAADRHTGHIGHGSTRARAVTR